MIAAIRNRTKEEQAIAISKIAEDVALQNVTDEALLLRRVLIAGSQTKPVHNLSPALTATRQAINDLDQEVKNVLFEHDIHQKMMVNSAQTILQMESSHKSQALSEHNESQQPAVTNGSIYKNDSGGGL